MLVEIRLELLLQLGARARANVVIRALHHGLPR